MRNLSGGWTLVYREQRQKVEALTPDDNRVGGLYDEHDAINRTGVDQFLNVYWQFCARKYGLTRGVFDAAALFFQQAQAAVLEGRHIQYCACFKCRPDDSDSANDGSVDQ